MQARRESIIYERFYIKNKFNYLGVYKLDLTLLWYRKKKPANPLDVFPRKKTFG